MKDTSFSEASSSIRDEKKKKKLEQIFGIKLFIQFSVIFFFLLAFLLFYNLNEKRVIKLETQKIILEDLIHQYERAQIGLENNIELFKADYINRAEAVEFILNMMDFESITKEDLIRISQLIQVNRIHLVSDEGVIVLTSSEDSLGLNLRMNEKSSAFYGLIDGTSDKDEVIAINVESIIKQDKRIYIGIKSELPGISMIQIDIPISIYEQATEPFSIKKIIESIPTEYEQALFVVDAHTGKLAAITTNNEQRLVFKEGETGEELLERLRNHTGQFSVRINDTGKHLTVMESGDYIFGIWTDTSSTYVNAIYEARMMALGLLVILGMIYWVVRILAKKYFFNEIDKINETAEKILDGNMEVEFSEGKSQEIMHLSQVLNRWLDSYIHKSDRMTNMIEKINSSVAMFECIYVIGKVFFSSNIVKLLDINEEQLKEVTSSIHSFKKFIGALKERDDEHECIRIGERYIKINVLENSQEFYGVIIDKTSEIVQILTAENQLEEARDKIKRDPLTRLYNRRGMEEEIASALANKPSSGLMMIFDLDNFKRINDSAGHPEGDKALKIFADCLRHNFRSRDIIARMGGDEFAVFIPENLREDIVEAKCRAVLQQVRIYMKEYCEKYNVSVSIGVAFVSEEAATYEHLYLITDAALYIAKECGKNTYVINKNNLKCIGVECIDYIKDYEKNRAFE